MHRLDLEAKAREHWEQWLRNRVAELKKEGTFQAELAAVAALAQKEIETLKKAGYRQHEAEEVALTNHILLPPEPEAALLDWEREELEEKEREYQKNLPWQVLANQEDDE